MRYAAKHSMQYSILVYLYVFSVVILEHPSDKTVFLNDSAFFSCFTRGGSSTYWKLNGTDYDDLPSEIRDDLAISMGSTLLSDFIDLTITARAKYNETRVQCGVENDDGGSVKVSNTGNVYIQGIYYVNTQFHINYT